MKFSRLLAIEGISYILKEAVKLPLSALLWYSGFLWIKNILKANGRTYRILVYHSVPPEYAKNFEKQILFLKQNYHILSLRETIKALKEDRKFDRKVIAITFDEAFANVYQVAVPILKKYSIPACFFVVPDFARIDPRDAEQFNSFCLNNFKTKESLPGMTWDEIKKVKKMGFEIGSHTKSHANLARLPREQLEVEIIGSKMEIERELGDEVSFFAFPFGRDVTITEEALNIIREAGYECCCWSTRGENSATTGLYQLHRDPIEPWWHPIVIRAILEGGFDFWKQRSDLSEA